MTSKTDPPSKLKAAVVGKEGDAFWYVTGNPEDSKNIRKAIMKAGDDPAMELPTHMIHAPDARETQMKVIDRGSETVKVPAGSFTTRHLHYPADRTDAWVHKDVVPYGVIKVKTTDAEMVLVGHGTGAKSMLTETPAKMPSIPGKPATPRGR